jgi:hypothetical protein
LTDKLDGADRVADDIRSIPLGSLDEFACQSLLFGSCEKLTVSDVFLSKNKRGVIFFISIPSGRNLLNGTGLTGPISGSSIRSRQAFYSGTAAFHKIGHDFIYMLMGAYSPNRCSGTYSRFTANELCAQAGLGIKLFRSFQ